MQRRRSILILIGIFIIAGCCPRLNIPNPDFKKCEVKTLVDMIYKDVMKALSGPNLENPTFLKQSEFEKEWKHRTVNWSLLLVDLETKAIAAGNTELANSAIFLNSTVSQLPESVEPYRRMRLTTLKNGVERLKKAL
ncbi:hypothetical protein ACFL9T_05195 [Thermodesulfobacteriota bacterium]